MKAAYVLIALGWATYLTGVVLFALGSPVLGSILYGLAVICFILGPVLIWKAS